MSLDAWMDYFLYQDNHDELQDFTNLCDQG